MSCLDLLHKAVYLRIVDLTDTVNLPNKVILWAPAVLEYLHSLAYSVALTLGALGSLNLCYDMKRSYINIVEKISFEFSCFFFLVFILLISLKVSNIFQVHFCLNLSL